MRLKLPPKLIQNLSVSAISDRLAKGRIMVDYRVIFFNNLVNSYGKSFRCLQRVITVSSANDAGEAAEKAKREFERLEDVPNWKYYAIPRGGEGKREAS